MLRLFSSGSNAYGQLANGTLEDAHTFQTTVFEDQPLGSLPVGTSRVLKVATGANHTLVLLEFEDRRLELWGCGDGRKGQLGSNPGTEHEISGGTMFKRIVLPMDTEGLHGYQPKFVEATWETSYAVLASEGRSDVVLSFGSDDYGDLGIGGRVDKKDFHVVRFDHLFPHDEALEIDSISSGQRHVIIQVRTSSSSALVGWGICRHGQLGSADSKNVAFSPLPRVITTDPSISCALGIHHTIVCHHPGTVVGFGSNRKGQLQVVERVSGKNVKSAQCTWNGTYLLLEDQGKWEIWSSGSNSRSQLGWESISDGGGDDVGLVRFPIVLDSRDTSISLACGSEHVLALVTHLDSSSPPEVWGWGWNEHGNLGLGHTEDVATPVRIWPQSNDGVIKDVCGIWSGSGTSWICVKVADAGRQSLD